MEQWFTESQFESYRHLGDHEMSRLIALMTRLEQDLEHCSKLQPPQAEI